MNPAETYCDRCVDLVENVRAQIPSLEQAAEWADEFQELVSTSEEQEKIKRVSVSDARFDILHFEEILGDAGPEEMFDPSALLMIIETLAELTNGVAVDPLSWRLATPMTSPPDDAPHRGRAESTLPLPPGSPPCATVSSAHRGLSGARAHP